LFLEKSGHIDEGATWIVLSALYTTGLNNIVFYQVLLSEIIKYEILAERR